MGRWIMLWGNFYLFYIFQNCLWFLFHFNFLTSLNFFNYLLGQDCQKQFLSASIFTLSLIGTSFDLIYLVCADYQFWTFSMLWIVRDFGVQVQPAGPFHGLPFWLWTWCYRGILGYGPNTWKTLARYHLELGYFGVWTKYQPSIS